MRDEEKNLPRFFASIKGLADEVIVVDTGSKDNTVRVARTLGAKVHHFPWRDDFSAARNESLKHATKDFILWLDGDDEVRREDHHKIRAHLRKHPGAGAYLRTYVEKEGRAMQLRIFPNHRDIRFEGRVHEQAIHSMEAKGIPTHSCSASIIHHGYNEPGALQEKLRRNKKLLEEETAERPGDLDSIFFLARTCLGLGDAESALKHLDAVIVQQPGRPLCTQPDGLQSGPFRKGVGPCHAGEDGRSVVGPLLRQVPLSRVRADPLSSWASSISRGRSTKRPSMNSCLSRTKPSRRRLPP